MSDGVIDCVNEEAWLAQRAQMLTASDVPAVLGFDPYNTAEEVWARKVHGLKKDLASVEAVALGHELQPAIVRLFAKATGAGVRDAAQFGILSHPTSPWLGATLDAQFLWTSDINNWCPLEAKLVGASAGRNWRVGGEDVCPIYVQVQLAVQVACADAPRGAVAALIAGTKFRHFIIERDREFEAAMLRRCAKFWRFVIEQIHPDDWSKA